MSNLSTLPKGDSAWLLRKAIQRVMQQVSVLETNIGASTTGNSANTQVIFNDNGILRGDPDLIFNTALNKLVVTNLEATAALTVGTTATIIGVLTAGTNSIIGTGSTQNAAAGRGNLTIGGTSSAILNLSINGADTGYIIHDGTNITLNNRTNGYVEFFANGLAQHRIEPLGIFTWYDGAGGTRMTLNSTGLGVGVTPSAWATNRRPLQIGGLASGAVALNGTAGSGEIFFNSFFNASSQNICVVTGGTGKYDFNVSTVGCHTWSVGTGTAGNSFTFTPAMTLDASGNLLVGTTTTSGNAGGLKLSNVAGNLGQITFSNNSGSADYVARFNWGSTPTLVGNITVSSGGTAFNTTSDYRLKESVQPLVGGLARVNALKPSIYKWKTDGSNGEGFLAHELAEVVPAAVTGEKDAVNEDGSIKPQGVDLSKVVPILVAAIKELTARVQTLEAK